MQRSCWLHLKFPLSIFSADTDVATSNGDTLRAISQIQIGDYVLAWDEETNSISFYPVTDTIHHTDGIVVHLTIDGAGRIPQANASTLITDYCSLIPPPHFPILQFPSL